MDLRKPILVLHRWIGLLAALALLAVGLSAALLIFERPIGRLLNHRLVEVTPGGARLPLNEIARRVRQTYPQYHVAGWSLPRYPNDAAAIVLEMNRVKPAAATSDEDEDDDDAQGLELTFNPYTGEVLGDLNKANDLMGYVHRFHTRFLAGDAGRTIVGWSAVCLLLLNLTGIILWWRRKIGRFRWSATGSAFHFHTHQAVGIYAWAFFMVLSLTGIGLHWENAGQLVDWLTSSPPPAKMLPADPVQQGAVPLDSDQLLSIAEKSAPGAQVTVIQMAAKPLAPVRIIMKYPEDHTPAGRTNLFLDAYTGKVRMLTDSRSAPLGFKLMRLWNRQYHTGDIFGWPTQLLALVSSLALLVMAITGPMIWYKRKRTSQAVAAVAAED